MNATHRRAAIFAVVGVGFPLMGEDEAGTVRAKCEQRETARPLDR